METLCGILVDVSGSMKRNVSGRTGHKNSKWARSIFRTVDNLIKHDTTSSNQIFAFGFGASKVPITFDLLNTVKNVTVPKDNRTKLSILYEIIDILESGGAPRVRNWSKINVLKKVIELPDARLILHKLKNDPNFKRRFIYDCLPKTCRELEIGILSFGREALYWGAGWFEGGQEFATENSVKDVVRKGKDLLSETCLVGINPASIMNVQKASEILHGCVDEDMLTNERVDKLMRDVEPYIYGETPLMKAMSEAKGLFATRQFMDYTKLMFILSDGAPTDGNNPPMYELNALNVKNVCCYITNDETDDPRRLYSLERKNWTYEAKFMFRMSSTITTQNIPRTIFLKREWTIDITNNETRLFAQVNHPDVIEDVCKLAKDVVCCQEALSDILTAVSLDLYINQANQDFRPKQQNENTCYANATAAVLHLAMQRIVERHGGYPDFFSIRDEIINAYERKANNQGVSSVRVLKEICPSYRLQCKDVDIHGAMEAIINKRPVLATFRLTDSEWDTFFNFYDSNGKGVLTKSDLDISKRSSHAETHGHAVVFIGFNSTSLRLMNSWGSSWADGGFFRVSANVIDLKFVDVFWKKANLLSCEIEAYKQDGHRVAQKLFSRLKGLQFADYSCPLCNRKSHVNEFKGHHLKAVCPKCGGNFNLNKAGDDLALNLYLLSISEPNKMGLV